MHRLGCRRPVKRGVNGSPDVERSGTGTVSPAKLCGRLARVH
jgi:hypothetical protein